MKKTMKTITVIVMALLVISLMSKPVRAASSYVATFDPQVDNTVQQGKSIIFDVAMTNFVDVGKGVNSFYAILDYDEEIFKDVKLDVYTRSIWTAPTFNKTTKKMVTESGTFVTSTSRVLTVELVAKADAQLGDTVVKLTNIRASGGDYDIIAQDKEVTVTVKEPKTIEPDNPNDPDSPVVDDEKRIIRKLSPYTSVNTFKNMFSNYAVKVFNLSGQEISGTSYIGTNMKAIIDDETYVLVVRGDLNGDGKLSTTDLSKMKAHMVGTQVLTTFYEMGADVNDDENVTVTDLSRLKQALIGLIKL